jgi:BarA-like signal transduction histidine kinase
MDNQRLAKAKAVTQVLILVVAAVAQTEAVQEALV